MANNRIKVNFKLINMIREVYIYRDPEIRAQCLEAINNSTLDHIEEEFIDIIQRSKLANKAISEIRRKYDPGFKINRFNYIWFIVVNDDVPNANQFTKKRFRQVLDALRIDYY